MGKVIYNENGDILRYASGKLVTLDTPLSDGEFELESDLIPKDIENYKVVNGEITRKSDSELQAITDAIKLGFFRQKRDNLLSQSDWTQFNDSPLTDTKKQEWATYRQALRDLPANTTDPRNPTWPTKPS